MIRSSAALRISRKSQSVSRIFRPNIARDEPVVHAPDDPARQVVGAPDLVSLHDVDVVGRVPRRGARARSGRTARRRRCRRPTGASPPRTRRAARRRSPGSPRGSRSAGAARTSQLREHVRRRVGRAVVDDDDLAVDTALVDGGQRRSTIDPIVASSLKHGKNAEIAWTAGFTGARGTPPRSRRRSSRESTATIRIPRPTPRLGARLPHERRVGRLLGERPGVVERGVEGQPAPGSRRGPRPARRTGGTRAVRRAPASAGRAPPRGSGAAIARGAAAFSAARRVEADAQRRGLDLGQAGVPGTIDVCSYPSPSPWARRRRMRGRERRRRRSRPRRRRRCRRGSSSGRSCTPRRRTARVGSSAPCACAASSSTGTPRSGSAAGRPYRCTGTTARVRSVTARRAAASASIVGRVVGRHRRDGHTHRRRTRPRRSARRSAAGR